MPSPCRRGPGAVGNAHGNDEHIAIADVTQGVFALALAACAWCGVAAAAGADETRRTP